MELPLEAVPNFSEGRDAATLDAIGAAFGGAPAARRPRGRGPQPLGLHAVGEDAALVEALVARRPSRGSGSTCAATRACTRAWGRPTSCRSCRSGPRTMERARRRRRCGGRADRRGAGCAGLPVRRVGAGRGPAFFRRGGPDELQRRVDAGELVPDFGPAQLHESRRRGAGRRAQAADRVQREPRGGELGGGAGDRRASCARRGGGFPGVRALGLELAQAGLAQVSMNVEDWEAAALPTSSRGIEREAACARRRGRRLGARRADARRAPQPRPQAGRSASPASTPRACSSCACSTS